MRSKSYLFLLITLIITATASLSLLYSIETTGQQTVSPAEVKYTADNNLQEISLIVHIPLGKLIEILDISKISDNHLKPIKELGIGVEDIERAQVQYKKDLWKYSANIVLLSMLVIFLSLALMGFFIGLLKSFVEMPKVSTAIGKAPSVTDKLQEKPETRRYNDIIAAIATLHLHIREAEESNRMIIAWQREPVSVWKTSGKLTMTSRVR